MTTYSEIMQLVYQHESASNRRQAIACNLGINSREWDEADAASEHHRKRLIDAVRSLTEEGRERTVGESVYHDRYGWGTVVRPTHRLVSVEFDMTPTGNFVMHRLAVPADELRDRD